MKLAIADPASPLSGAAPEDVDIVDGWLQQRSDPSRREPLAAPIARRGGQPIEARMTAQPGDERKKFSMHSFGAVFAEVHVDPDLARSGCSVSSPAMVLAAC